VRFDGQSAFRFGLADVAVFALLFLQLSARMRPMKAGIALALISVIACFVVPGATATLPGYNGKIAFSSDRPDFSPSDIWVVQPDGKQPTKLTKDDINENIDPAWSPDGSKIAYSRGYGGSLHEIWVMGANGSSPKALTAGFIDEWPAWSPDGTKLAFASTRPLTGSSNNRHIWVMNADGSNLYQLTDDSTTVNAWGTRPDWSPDGTRIAFDDGRDVYVMDADGSHVTRLTTDPNVDGDPSFSPDGKSIAFSSNRANDYANIYVMSSSGADQTRLTFTDHAGDFSPVWSPDGKWIAFASNRWFGTSAQIWLITANGSYEAPLVPQVDEDDGAPSWQRTSVPPSSPAKVKCRVPNVVGQTLAKAKNRIRARHCLVGRITRVRSSVARKGWVIAQSPKGGKTLKSKAKIALKVGRGP
jgi:TolB protein